MRTSSRLLARVLLPLAISAGAVVAQCANEWVPGSPIPGVDGAVRAGAWWDADGAGPAPELLVVAGPFTAAGNLLAGGLAAWDPASQTWSTPFGSVVGEVSAIVASPTGELVLGGAFTTIGGQAISRLARWNGAAWAPIGGGVDGDVLSLRFASNGDLEVGGRFTHAGGVAIDHIARWDGTAWSGFGVGVDGDVYWSGERPNGDVIVAATFPPPGAGQPVKELRRWNGTGWMRIPGEVYLAGPVTVAANGDLIAFGAFTVPTGVSGFARWNGIAWAPMGGYSSEPRGLVALPNGDLWGYGYEDDPYFPFDWVGRWNGSSFFNNGAAVPVSALCPRSNGDIYVGGGFHFVSTGARSVGKIAPVVGVEALGQAMGLHSLAPIHALTVTSDGTLFAATDGYGTSIGDVSARFASWDGVTWTSLLSGPLDRIGNMLEMSDGTLYATGSGDSSGIGYGILRAYVAGQQVPVLQPWFNVLAITEASNGDLIAAGTDHYATVSTPWEFQRFDGTSWTPLASQNPKWVSALVTMPNGDVVAGGNFTSAGGVTANHVAIWDGVSWGPLGNGMDATVNTLLLTSAGDLIAGGSFLNADSAPVGHIARWNGSGWQALGTGVLGPVRTLLELPNGDLLVGGDFTMAGGVVSPYLARWTGSVWEAVPAGLDGQVRSMAMMANGDVVVGGQFSTAGVFNSGRLVALTTDCPASVDAHGVGCASSGGANTLAATNLPWLGGTFHTTAIGLPTTAIAIAVTGFAPVNVPLASILPFGAAGCDLLAQPDLLDLALTTNGRVDVRQQLADSPALAGLVLYQQVVPIELDAFGGFVEATATNALEVTVGFF